MSLRLPVPPQVYSHTDESQTRQLIEQADAQNVKIVKHPSSALGWINVKEWGAKGDGITDDTAAIQSALNAGHAVFIPDSVYLVSQIVPNAGNVVESSINVTLKQKSGVNLPIVDIQHSNITLGSLSFTGNISTDTGEYNHCVNIAPSTSVSNILLGDLAGTDIRGDVLYVGGTPSQTVKNVRAGIVSGANIYRNIVSITGGDGTVIQGITGYQYGHRALDVEPNGASSQTPDNIHIGFMLTGEMIVVGASTNSIGSIIVDFAEFDASLKSNSSPGYSTYDATVGVLGTYWKLLRFSNLRCYNFIDYALCFLAGSGDLIIDRYEGSGNASALVNVECRIEGCNSVRIHSGKSTLATKTWAHFSGNPTTTVIENFVGNGRFGYLTNGILRNITVDLTGTASGTAAFSQLTNMLVVGVTVTGDGGGQNVFDHCTNIDFRNVTATSAGFTGAACDRFQGDRVAAPASATSTGQFGQIAEDSGFRYFCTGNNAWKRVAIAAW